MVLTSCDTGKPSTQAPAETFKLTKTFPNGKFPVTFEDSIIASPLADFSETKPKIIAPVSNGEIAALDADTGVSLWQLKLPVPDGQQAELIATPVIVGGKKLVVVYQCLDKGVRASHRAVVIDLPSKKIDKSYPSLTFSAEVPTVDGKTQVKFYPPTAYSHAALKHLPRPGLQGLVYVGFGNAGDAQPFHGWLFEIDMDAWQTQGAEKALKNVLLTTPETDCPTTVEYGTQEMVCGGGVWVPSGPLLEQNGAEMEIIVPTGNGQVDLARHDYANALLRMKPGLQFDPGCDAALCAHFDAANADQNCMASCKHLFMPRLQEDDAPLKPPNHECDDKDFWECLAWMDYDLGSSTPIKVKLASGKHVFVQAAKDGGAYLLDAEHLGTQYDRIQIAHLCGSATDLCKLSWAGMIVTQPVQTRVGDEPVVVIPTFSPDKTNVAGLVALKIVEDKGQIKFKHFWRFPEFANPQALQMFRSHPSFPLLTSHLGRNREAIIWIVDIGMQGTIYGIRAKDGALVAKHRLQGTGRQLSMPVMIGNTLYLASTMPNTGMSMMEAYRIEPTN
jgi:hypothetical protein